MGWAGGAHPGLAQGSPAGVASVLSADHRPLARRCSPPASLAELLSHKGELPAQLWAIPRLHRLEEERKLRDASEKPGEEHVLLVKHQERARRGAKHCGLCGECRAVPREPLHGWGRGGRGQGRSRGRSPYASGEWKCCAAVLLPRDSGEAGDPTAHHGSKRRVPAGAAGPFPPRAVWSQPLL